MSTPNITIEGRLVATPEMKFSQNGKPYTQVRVACSDSRKGQGDQWETIAQLFVNATFWDADAERVANAHQGSKVVVAGRLHEREYETRDGGKGRSLELRFPMIQILPDQQGGQQQGGYTSPQQGYQQQPPQPDPWAQPAPTGDQPPW